MTNAEFTFLDIKMRWSPEGELQFGVFRSKGKQLKYFGKESTHTPGTLRAIPSVVLNCLAKFTSREPSIHSEGVDQIYPDHANTLRKAGLVPPNFPIMGYYGVSRMRKLILKKNETSTKIETEMSNFVFPTHIF